MNKFLSITLAAGIYGLATAASAADLTIDLFDPATNHQQCDTVIGGGPDNNCTDLVTSTPYASSGAGDILGGERDIWIDRIAPAGIGTATIRVADGKLSISNDDGVASVAVVQWDGVDSAIGGPGVGLGMGLGADLSGFTAFKVTTIKSDLGFIFSLGLYTDASNFTVVTLVASAVPSPTDSLIPLAGFGDGLRCGEDNAPGAAPDGVISVVCGGVGGDQPANLASVGAIELAVTGTDVDLDLSLDQIVAVPTPSTLALFGLGLLATGFGIRRRK
jgi:hypothetical protein